MEKANFLERLGLKADKPVTVTGKHDFNGNGITIVVQGNEKDSKVEQPLAQRKS